MKQCPICDTPYTDENTTCSTDGALLIEIHEWAPGSLIRNKYRILGKIGIGGMGIVYKAEHIVLEEIRALKVMNPRLATDQRFVRRFRQEAQAARRLQHANIVHVDDCEQADDGSFYIAMDFVEGVTLRQLLRAAGGPLPVPRALAIARGVADALSAADALGMVHRDIKPENILLARDRYGRDVPKVTDFGIAAMRESAVVSSTRPLLTPAYASPEQWRGMKSNELDGRTDLYALGVTLYEMVAGQLPFHAHTDEGWMRAHLDEQPVPPSQHNPELVHCPGLDTLVLVLLSKDRDDRPRTGLALVQEFNLVEAQSNWGQPTVPARRPVEPASPPLPATPPPTPAPLVSAATPPILVSAPSPLPDTPIAVTPLGASAPATPIADQPATVASPAMSVSAPSPHPALTPPKPALSPFAASDTPAVSPSAALPTQPVLTPPPPAPSPVVITPVPQEAAPPRTAISPLDHKPAPVPPRPKASIPARPKPAAPSIPVPPVQRRSQRKLLPVVLSAAALVLIVSVIAFLGSQRKSPSSSSTASLQPQPQQPSGDTGDTTTPGPDEPGERTVPVVPADSNQAKNPPGGRSSPGNKPNQQNDWKTFEDTQSKIAKIQQDVTANKAATQDKAYKKWDEYIRSDSPGPPSSSSAKVSADYIQKGDNYYYGKGVPVNYPESLKWYRKAADLGSPKGQYDVGYMYENGRGVTKDNVEALKWFRKAADLGNPDAQNTLGGMYLDGEGGVQRDYVEAVRWYRKAADQGDPAGQNNLGWMYKEGHGVPVDSIEALKWFLLAQSGYSPAATNLAALKSRMTAEQIAEAERRAKSWHPHTKSSQ